MCRLFNARLARPTGQVLRVRGATAMLCHVVVVGAIVVGAVAPVHAQHAYAGVWREGTDGYALWVNDSWTGFVTQWQNLSAQGQRLIDLETDDVGGQQRFSGVYRAGTDGYALWAGASWDDFIAQWNAAASTGLRLIDFETWLEAGTQRYAGVWRAGSDGYALWAGPNWDDFIAAWTTLSGQGLRLVDFETWKEGGTWRYAGVFRAGTDGHALWAGDTWPGFAQKWQDLAAVGLRLIDLETYVQGGMRRYAGVFRSGVDGYALLNGIDYENFISQWNSLAGADERLIDMERYPGCSSFCANKVVAPDSYNYTVTGEMTYRWPVDASAVGNFVRLSAVHFQVTPFLSLPFSDPQVNRIGTWRYHNDTWHHAIDYLRNDYLTYSVNAMAPGDVVHVGWDNWSGNTVIVSHNVDGVADAFRTLYMHLRNGADADCSRAWANSVPSISDPLAEAEYRDHLNATGCPEDPSMRNPDPSFWGTNAETIPVSVGQSVARGQQVAWAGNTGPGGKRGVGDPNSPNTHLHLFTARRDPTDNRYYFVDPYGIYASPSCYPATPGVQAGGPCARYPNLWGEGGSFTVFQSAFEWGDLSGWSSVEGYEDPRP